MGRPGGRKPGSLRRRYDALDPSRRRLYYYMRRHLGYSPAEVDAMPMLHVLMFVDGMVEEFSGGVDENGEPIDGADSDDGFLDQIGKHTEEAPALPPAQAESNLDTLAGLGIQVRRD